MAGPSEPLLPSHRPRTPSPERNALPPYSTPERLTGLGLYQYESPTIKTHLDYDVQQGISDSPTKQPQPPQSSRLDSASLFPSPAVSSTIGGLSPSGSFYTPITPQTGESLEPSPQKIQDNPFNFTTQQYVAGKGSAKAADALGKRKGHKYRHSSMHVSAIESIIQSPALRTPLAVPASLPIPTRKEIWRSLTSIQTGRLLWCLAHFTIAAFIQFTGMSSLSLTALSRLVVFDAVGAAISVIVDVMSNFEVWKRSSIKHPFGLQRADVLAGFGMAVLIGFMGLDIVSHGIEHSLENLGAHESHHEHEHEHVTAEGVLASSLAAVVSTLISAILLKNHKRIGKATNVEMLAGGGRVLGNPSHVLTLSCSVLLLILPRVSDQTYKIYDFALSVSIAVLMISFGVRLGISLASMLLMSYKPPSNDRTAIRDTISDIETEPGVRAVEEARIWQVHYGLCMANFKLRCRAGGDEMTRLRQRVMSLIRQRLGGSGSGWGGGGKGPKWEVNVQISVEKD